MAEIIREEIRARIVIHTTPRLVVDTPYVLSFNVSKQRGQMIGSFSATIQVKVEDLPNSNLLSGQGIEIYAGLKDNLKKIFTGEIRFIRINPSWDKPEYLNLDISGSDVLQRLETKRYSRRIPWSSGGVWARIIRINSTKGRKKQRLLDTKINITNSSVVLSESPDLAQGDHDRVIYARDLSSINPYGIIPGAKAESKTDKEVEFTVEYVNS